MAVLAESFIRFIYPLLFDAETFLQRAATIDSAECGDMGRFWEPKMFPEAELLLHVARYLNPPEGTLPTARLWRISPKVLRSPKGLGAGAENPGANWYLARGGKETPFLIEDVQLALFHTGVGFLMVRARPKTEELPEWLDFLHFFRFLRRSEMLTIGARRRTGLEPQTKQPIVEPYFPALACAGNPAEHSGLPGELVAGLLRSGASREEADAWWSEVFIAGQWLPYAVLFVDQVPPGEQPHVLYRVHNFFHTRQGEHPADDELQLDQPHLMSYARDQRFLFSLDGGAFVAFDPPNTPFYRQTLPDHLDEHYLLVLMLALHQRFAMMRFLEQVSGNWLVSGNGDPLPEEIDARREIAFERIRDALLSFTARGYFAQIMQRRHHHRCYLKWQETFQIERLFQEVTSGVRDMNAYLNFKKTERLEDLAEASRRLELRLSWLAGLFIVPALVLGYVDAIGGGDWAMTGAYFLAGLAAGFLLMLLLHHWEKTPIPQKRAQKRSQRTSRREERAGPEPPA